MEWKLWKKWDTWNNYRNCLKLEQYDFNPTALRKTKIVYNFGLSECSMVNIQLCVQNEWETV